MQPKYVVGFFKKIERENECIGAASSVPEIRFGKQRNAMEYLVMEYVIVLDI